MRDMPTMYLCKIQQRKKKKEQTIENDKRCNIIYKLYIHIVLEAENKNKIKYLQNNLIECSEQYRLNMSTLFHFNKFDLQEI